MSTGMRKVRRDPTSSASAPRLFSSHSSSHRSGKATMARSSSTENKQKQKSLNEVFISMPDPSSDGSGSFNYMSKAFGNKGIASSSTSDTNHGDDEHNKTVMNPLLSQTTQSLNDIRRRNITGKSLFHLVFGEINIRKPKSLTRLMLFLCILFLFLFKEGSHTNDDNYLKIKEPDYIPKNSINKATAMGDTNNNLRQSENNNDNMELPSISSTDPEHISNKEHHMQILELPAAYGNFADITAPFSKKKTDSADSSSSDVFDIPFFWDIHLNGGTIVEHVFGKCYKLLQASEIGMQHPLENKNNAAGFDESLNIVNVSGEKYLNIDTTTVQGIQRAKSLGLFSSPDNKKKKKKKKRASKGGLPDDEYVYDKHFPSVIYSPMITHIGEMLFTPQHRGRMFTIIRHPVDRAVGMYYYLQTATWDPLYDPNLSKMTLEEYASSSSMENNWLTRFLVEKPGGKLSEKDLELAKEILRRKCLIGLFTDMHSSLMRFEKYFHLWEQSLLSTTKSSEGTKKEDSRFNKKVILQNVKKCTDQVMRKGDKRHDHPLVTEESDSKAWNAMVRHNRYDMELYKYAQEIYKEQGSMFFGRQNE